LAQLIFLRDRAFLKAAIIIPLRGLDGRKLGIRSYREPCTDNT
jgi:hypothetical protein